MKEENKEKIRTVLSILAIPFVLFGIVLMVVEIFAPIDGLAYLLQDCWDITMFQGWVVVLGWLFWLIASILTGTVISNDGHEDLSVVLGASTAILFGVLINIIFVKRIPLLCGIISLFYMGIMLYYRLHQEIER